MDMAHAQKESWDSAMPYRRLAQIQRDAGYSDLAEVAEQNAAAIIASGNEMAEKRGERWEEARRRKFENLSRLLSKIDDLRGQVRNDQKTKEINVDREVLFDDDAVALLNIGRRGFPPLKKSGSSGSFEEVIFPIEDDMVLVEKFAKSSAGTIITGTRD